MIHPAKNPQPNGFNLATFAPSLDAEAGESLGEFLSHFEDPMCDECDSGVSESDFFPPPTENPTKLWPGRYTADEMRDAAGRGMTNPRCAGCGSYLNGYPLEWVCFNKCQKPSE